MITMWQVIWIGAVIIFRGSLLALVTLLTCDARTVIRRAVAAEDAAIARARDLLSH